MSNCSTANTEALVTGYLDAFPGDEICARQIWYEALNGHGVPSNTDMAAMYAVLDSLDGWKSEGDVRYEKFGVQPSYRRKAPKETPGDKIMVHHLFKVGGLYQAPDGRVFKVVLSEVYNLRCFEVQDGDLTGPMVKIHPTSELAKSLIEI